MCNPVQEIENAGKGIEKLVQSTGNSLERIARDPLPVIQTIALTYALGPAGAGLSTGTAALVTSAAISAANGGRVEDIALNMAAAYAGSQIGEYAGQSMPPETTAMVKQVVTSASASAATTALRGGDFNQILASGVSGSVNGYVATSLKEQGFTNVDNKLITNAATAATSAILNGRSVSDALSQSVTATLLTAAIQGQVDQLNKNNELGQSLASKADSLAKEADTFFNNNFGKNKYNILSQVNVSTDYLNNNTKMYNGNIASIQYNYDQYQYWADKAANSTGQDAAFAVIQANNNADQYKNRLSRMDWYAAQVGEASRRYDRDLTSYNNVVDKYTTQYAKPLADLNTQYETLVAQTTELSTSLADNVLKYQDELKLNSNALAEQIGKQALEEATKLLTPPVAEVPPAESETPVTDTVATTDEPLPPYEPEPAPVEPAPVEPAPVEPAPVEPAPVEPAPVEPAPVEPAPVEPVPVEPTPVEPAPVEPAPVEPAPVEPAPVPVEPEPVPVEPTPVEPEPVPVEPTPVEPEPTPVEPVPVEPTPVPEEPVQEIPEIVITAPREPKEPESEFDVLIPPTTPTPTTPTPVTPKPVTPTPVIPKPVIPRPVTPVVPVAPKPTTPAAKTGGLDMAALMALLASMGGNTNQQPATPPPTVDIGDQFDFGAPLETNPFAKQQTQTKMAQGGSIDDLLALLRRG